MSKKRIVLKSVTKKGTENGQPYEHQREFVELTLNIPLSDYGYLLNNIYLILGELPKVSDEFPDLQDAISSVSSNLFNQLAPCELSFREFFKNQQSIEDLTNKVKSLEWQLEQCKATE